MNYLMLNKTDQSGLLSKLEAMPGFLEASFRTVSETSPFCGRLVQGIGRTGTSKRALVLLRSATFQQ
jgi:hypothetical protein